MFSSTRDLSHLRHLSQTAKLPNGNFEHDLVGYNYRMPNLNAALGCSQMEKLPYILGFKRKLAKRYADFCGDLPVQFVSEPSGSRSNLWIKTLLCESSAQRQRILKQANDADVMMGAPWKFKSNLSL